MNRRPRHRGVRFDNRAQGWPRSADPRVVSLESGATNSDDKLESEANEQRDPAGLRKPTLTLAAGSASVWPRSLSVQSITTDALQSVFCSFGAHKTRVGVLGV